MSIKTRRTLLWCAIVAVIALPSELVLLTALAEPGSSASNWVAQLSLNELSGAAQSIDKMPLQYRKAIVKALPPSGRAEAWRRPIREYLAQHPSLADAQRKALNDAMEFFTPKLFSAAPSDEDRARLTAISDTIGALFGEQVKAELMHGMGPRVTSMAALPLRIRLVESIRSLSAVEAFADCECSNESDYCWGQGEVCTGLPLVTCNAYCEWPACGSGWFFCCDGNCRGI